MNRSIFRAAGLAALSLLISLPPPAGAQDYEGIKGMGVGLAAGFGKPSDSLFSGGLSAGLVVSIGLMKYLAVELQGGILMSGVEGSADGLSKGTLNAVPIQLSLLVRYPVAGGRLLPFLEMGGGYYLNNFALDSQLLEDWEQIGFTVEEKVENTLGFHFGLGLDYFLSRNLALGLGFRYGLANAEAGWSLTDIASSTEVSGDLESIGLNPLTIALRLRYVFK
ncbi:MAG: outer membrane beta-barrel protein [Candidatus Aminicenantes bacterium]|nr:outer membrane beta-barrel protein [Candidatus Aminicenantes bacterium]